jgi:hypothetical protein
MKVMEAYRQLDEEMVIKAHDHLSGCRIITIAECKIRDDRQFAKDTRNNVVLSTIAAIITAILIRVQLEVEHLSGTRNHRFVAILQISKQVQLERELRLELQKKILKFSIFLTQQTNFREIHKVLR